MQICQISEELLKTEYDALRIVYNRFGSAVSFKPTIATVLSPDVSCIPACTSLQPCAYSCHLLTLAPCSVHLAAFIYLQHWLLPLPIWQLWHWYTTGQLHVQLQPKQVIFLSQWKDALHFTQPVSWTCKEAKYWLQS